MVLTNRDKLFARIKREVLRTHHIKEEKRILDPRHREGAYPFLDAEDLSETAARNIIKLIAK